MLPMPTPFLGELLHGLALSVALGHRALLAVIERRRPAELRALAFGALDPFLAALADQAALELGNAASSSTLAGRHRLWCRTRPRRAIRSRTTVQVLDTAPS
jgi:hypothetical protein